MIEYVSYERVNDLYFGNSPKRAIEVFGEAKDKFEDEQGNTILMYSDYTISFDLNQKFFYFALHPQTTAKINGKSIGWTFDDIKPIITLDSNPTESSGFIILRDLGVAIVDFHTSEDDDFSDKVIVFFREGEFDENIRMEQSFKLNDQL